MRRRKGGIFAVCDNIAFIGHLTHPFYGGLTRRTSVALYFSEHLPSSNMSKLHGAICIDDFMHRQLEDRTNILECAWQERHDNNESDESETEAAQIPKRSDFAFQETQEGRDIYGKVTERAPNEFEHLSRFSKLSVYLSWIVLIIFAYIREALRKWGLENDKASKELPRQKDFVPLFADFESVYARNCYVRVRDVFERPIGSVPGATVNLIDRTSDDCNWTYRYPGTQTNVINVSSYNYLGFAQASGPCADAAVAQIDKEGLATCTTVHERGRSTSQYELEKLVAEFLHVEDAIVFSMGFATNSMNAPCLVDKHSLIVSDQHNHASLILGCRLSGASTKVFAHNDMNSLEKILRNAIAYGNPKTHRPYKKILIIVEGIYSMEGSICNLPGVIALKKKYGAYLYLDEAHSIGAMGSTGRGVVEYWGCNPMDVDILMGTFTKSFGAAGGYIAGSKKAIDHLRVNSPTGYYSCPMAPPVAQQIYTSMSIIMGKDGTNDGARRIEQLARNARYFRLRLKQLGFIVYGSDDSPVVPVLLYYPAKCGIPSTAKFVASFPHDTEHSKRTCASEKLNLSIEVLPRSIAWYGESDIVAYDLDLDMLGRCRVKKSTDLLHIYNVQSAWCPGFRKLPRLQVLPPHTGLENPLRSPK
ncbi:aminotransferase, class I/II [Teladorsagia circumcincta]|uniref:serine C-palmitoyltransferase n=1 Tax=Teladorsagia circumcincta TaxID=45464 RepID=A0A2G9UDF7_TELCI|nr:aminotransferase, class I/II [Teladorsagia circumcincta]